MAKEREVQAREAKERAHRSRAEMDSVLRRYEEVRSRVEATRRTLRETAEKVQRQNAIQECIGEGKNYLRNYGDFRAAGKYKGRKIDWGRMPAPTEAQ